MEGTTNPSPTREPHRPLACLDAGQSSPFSRQWVTITKQEHIDLTARANYWEAQHGRAKSEIEKLRQEAILKDAKIKDIQNRLFGKKSEKNSPLKSEKGGKDDTPSRRKRGQQPGSQGHGRTKRPDLPIVHDEIDLADEEKSCPTCGLPHLPTPALDEHSDVIEVEVKAHVRRIRRPAYTRNPGCTCEDTPVIVTAPPPPRLIPRSPYGVSFRVEAILSKYRYGQPSNRSLQDLGDQGLPVSPGTLAGGLQALAPLFEPVLEALYCKQMSERLFHNDETRWEVFVEIEGKVGTRWYLWVTRSPSVVFYCIDPSRSAAVPGAHFAGLQAQLQRMHEEATRIVAPENDDGTHGAGASSVLGADLSKSAGTKRKKVFASLLEHWSGLTVFVENPEVPMDNNRAENTIRTPVNGRKNYYGSGSIWSAQLAATLFAILQTLALWGINPRHWLTLYLTACAENGGRAPQTIDPFLPWSMEEARRAALSRPSPSRAPAAAPTELPSILDSS